MGSIDVTCLIALILIGVILTWYGIGFVILCCCKGNPKSDKDKNEKKEKGEPHEIPSGSERKDEESDRK